jgi:predicted PurR-regulated permease PerM
MVPTEVLLTVVLSAFALLGGAFYALVHVLGRRLDDLSNRLESMDNRLSGRIDSLEGRIESMDRRLGGKIDALAEQVSGLRAAVAGLDARLTTLERGSG